MHVHRVGRMDNRDTGRIFRTLPFQQAADFVLRADEDNFLAVGFRGQHAALYRRERRVVAAHYVNRNFHRKAPPSCGQ